MPIAYNVVDAPEITPRKFGLFSVAQQPPTDPHDLMGIEFEKNDNCLYTLKNSTAQWCGTHPNKVKTEAYAGVTQFEPFHIYAMEECAGPSASIVSKFQADAVRKFNIGAERAIEAQLVTQMIADPIFFDQSPTTPVDVRRSIALAEEIIDDNYGGVGTILVSRQVGSLALSTRQVQRHGNRLETELGNLVVASGQFGAGPSAAGTGNEWMIVTGSIEVRRGAMFASDPLLMSNAGATAEQQTVSITGVPTGGSFTLTFDGQTTAGIAYNANSTAVRDALQALSNIADTGDVSVSGTNPNFTVTFTVTGNYGGMNPPEMTATSSLTGGTAPAVAIATSVPGTLGTPDNSWRVLVEQTAVLSYDCVLSGIKTVVS